MSTALTIALLSAMALTVAYMLGRNRGWRKGYDLGYADKIIDSWGPSRDSRGRFVSKKPDSGNQRRLAV